MTSPTSSGRSSSRSLRSRSVGATDVGDHRATCSTASSRSFVQENRPGHLRVSAMRMNAHAHPDGERKQHSKQNSAKSARADGAPTHHRRGMLDERRNKMRVISRLSLVGKYRFGVALFKVTSFCPPESSQDGATQLKKLALAYLKDPDRIHKMVVDAAEGSESDILLRWTMSERPGLGARSTWILTYIGAKLKSVHRPRCGAIGQSAGRADCWTGGVTT